MKKFLFSMVLAVGMIAGVMAQSNQLPVDAGSLKPKQGEVGAQSSTVTMSEKGINYLWLNDGHDSLAAISYTIAPIQGTNGRLRLQALGAADPSDFRNKAYLTLGLAYNLFSSANLFRVDLFGGPKGFNIADGFKFERGKNSFIFGFGITIPIGS